MKKILFVLMIAFFLVPIANAMRVDESSGALATTYTVASVQFEQDSYTVPVNTTTILNVRLNNVAGCTCWQLYVYYSRAIVTAIKAYQGPFLKQFGGAWFGYMNQPTYNATHGRIAAYCVLLGMTAQASGSGIICSIKFQTLQVGASMLNIRHVMLGDTAIPPKALPVVTYDSACIVI